MNFLVKIQKACNIKLNVYLGDNKLVKHVFENL